MHTYTHILTFLSLFLLQQFMYVELSAIENELKKMDSKETLPRSCQDLRTQRPQSPSGHYTIDPNVGSKLDSIKCFCEFESRAAKTCIKVCVCVWEGGGGGADYVPDLFHCFVTFPTYRTPQQPHRLASYICYIHVSHSLLSYHVELRVH